MDTKKIAAQAAETIAQDAIERFGLDGRKVRFARERWAELIAAALAAEAAPGTDGGRLFTTHDVAALLKCDASTVSKWIDKGTLIAFRTPGGHRRVQEAHLRAFAQKYEMPVQFDQVAK